MSKYIFDATDMGGGNRAILLSSLDLKDSTSKKALFASDQSGTDFTSGGKLTMGDNTIYYLTDSGSYEDTKYNTIVCDRDFGTTIGKITGADNYYIIVGIRNNKTVVTDMTKIDYTNGILSYAILDNLHTFSTLSLNGGARAVYLSKLYDYLLLENDKKFTIPDNDLGIDTIVIDKENKDYQNLKVTLNNGGFIVVNIRMTSDDKIMKLNIQGGTFVYNTNNNMIGYKSTDTNNDNNYNCIMIVNKGVQLYNQTNNIIRIYELLNYGQVLLNGDVNKINSGKEKFATIFGKENNISNVILNYGYIRFHKYNDCEIHGSISNSGKIFICNEVTMHSRFSNDEDGELHIETNGEETQRKAGKLHFDITNDKYNYEYLINNRVGIIDVKENGVISLNGEKNTIKDKLKYIIFNTGVVKFDGLLSNKCTQKEIYNDINSVIYLENDFNVDSGDIRFCNNGVIISYDKDENVNGKIDNKGRHLNIATMQYSKYQNQEKICLYNESNNDSCSSVQELLFELNSLDIKHDVLMTIIYLLSKKKQDENQKYPMICNCFSQKFNPTLLTTI